MNNEELIVNNEKYKCCAFDVGAGPVSAQRNKYDTNPVGACIARPHKCKCNANGITLIALIITIIIMLILAGIVLNLTLGEHGIFKTAQNAGNEYEKTKIKEEIELAVLDIEQEEIASENEITLEKIKEKLPGKLNNITAELEDSKITGTYKGYKYEVDGKFNVTIGKNNGTNIDEEEETKGKLTISKDLQMWLDRANEKITLQDILEDETVGEVKGLIPTITEDDVERTEENGIVKYTDTTGGIVSTNSEHASYPAYIAFNGIKDVENYTVSRAGEALNYWLEYEFKENVKAIYARVRLDTGTQYSWERIMKLQAFNEDNNEWEDLIEERTYQVIGHNAPEDILALNSTKVYKRFRIYIPSIGNSTGNGVHHSGVITFQLYGMKTNDNSITNAQIEQKLISSTNINIELSNAVNMNSLMDRLMYKKASEDVILTNENIRNAVLKSEVALSKAKGLIPTLTKDNVTRTEEDGIVKYTDTTGGVVSTNSEYSSDYPAYFAFNGIREPENNYAASKVGEAENYWLEYEFKENVKAIYAKVRIDIGSSYYGERTMKFQAFNEEKNDWEDLVEDRTYTGSKHSFPEDMLEFTSNKSYKRYRIYISSIGNSTGYGANISGVVTFQLYGIEEK